MKKLISLILGITFVFGCTSNNNSNTDNGPSANSYSYSQGANITDIDGNSYPTIVTSCSNQRWMQNNLNVSHYRNGDLIPQVTNASQWANLSTGAWCYYNNDPANGAIYGKLYNWYAVNDPRGLSPQGWHIPAKSEYTTLINCLSGEYVAGGKMKEIANFHWDSPNTAATNESGFTGLPGSSFLNNFGNLRTYGIWWSSSEQSSTTSFGYSLNKSTSACFSGNYDKKSGQSVRCIKD